MSKLLPEQKTNQDGENSPNDNLDIPDIGVKWSLKKVIITFFVCIILAVIGVFGYLYYLEKHRPAIVEPELPFNKSAPDQKNYNNDYWGFKFSYPGSWYPAIGSFEEGNYFFASERVNFSKELDEDNVILEVIPFQDLKNLGFDEWIKYRQENYLPAGKVLEKEKKTVENYQAYRYYIELAKPPDGRKYWDATVVFNGQNRYYYFILESKTKQTHDNFEDVFSAILNTLQFYPGYTP